jgi:hypothetical protein
MNPGIYGLGGQVVTPVQGPFSGVADTRKLLSVQALIVGGGAAGVTATNVRVGPGGGGGGVVEQTLGIVLGTSYSVTIAGGGAVGALPGNNSSFGSITAAGGGTGSTSSVGFSLATGAGYLFISGNSNGGSRNLSYVTTQGYAGGLGVSAGTAGGGGGGSGAQGNDATSTVSGSGGSGRVSTITGSSVTYGGGGGSGGYTGTSTAGSGGSGGGGSGSASVASAGTAGTANTGGGGGGGASNGTTFSVGGAGGSGVVIIRWNASQAVATLSAGLTFQRTTVGTDTVITITGGTGTVTFN